MNKIQRNNKILIFNMLFYCQGIREIPPKYYSTSISYAVRNVKVLISFEPLLL